MSQFRMQKIDSEIRNLVSKIINKLFCDELNFPTINFVITSKDLKTSKIYISFASEDQEKQFKKLESRSYLVQREFANSIKLRKTPKLIFLLDTKQSAIDKVETILDKFSKQ